MDSKDLLNRATELDTISICPHCWKTHDLATAVNTTHIIRPKPGDLTCCMRCGEFSMFGKDLDLEPIPTEVMQLLPAETLNDMRQAQADLNMLKKRVIDDRL